MLQVRKSGSREEGFVWDWRTHTAKDEIENQQGPTAELGTLLLITCEGFPGAQPVKNPPAMREAWVRSLGGEDPLEKGKATHSSVLAWRIPWTLETMGLQRVWHDWATLTFYEPNNTILILPVRKRQMGRVEHICPGCIPRTKPQVRWTRCPCWIHRATKASEVQTHGPNISQRHTEEKSRPTALHVCSLSENGAG